MDRGQFRTYFRFERDDVRSLCRALQVPENVTTPQGVHVSGVEALCLTLRRSAYPNRLRELEPLFGRHYSVISSATNAVLAHINSTFEHLLLDVNNHTWLDIAKLQLFSEGSYSITNDILIHVPRFLWADEATATNLPLAIYEDDSSEPPHSHIEVMGQQATEPQPAQLERCRLLHQACRLLHQVCAKYIRSEIYFYLLIHNVYNKAH
ncbi:hypothetical protein HPB51_004826 [Rhipicephalus microplus]|uniref:Uncharacterized protein n=1 Tax=Rhipicephalus microplus TaxID=6941 RepID=A0A9J6EX58_RHIMP|nr:hypothetical protein HPB51_004826 [Rhipicephalus microplus]